MNNGINRWDYLGMEVFYFNWDESGQYFHGTPDSSWVRAGGDWANPSYRDADGKIHTWMNPNYDPNDTSENPMGWGTGGYDLGGGNSMAFEDSNTAMLHQQWEFDLMDAFANRISPIYMSQLTDVDSGQNFGSSVGVSRSTSTGTTITITVNGSVPNFPLGLGRVVSLIGAQHQWITTSSGQSAGMGNRQGVPGERGQTSPDIPFSPTQVVDHTGRVPQTTNTITGVDSRAVSEWLQTGRQTGPWIPFCNDCNTWVDDVVQNSRPQMRSNRPWNPFENPMATEVIQGNPGRQTVILPDGTARVVFPD